MEPVSPLEEDLLHDIASQIAQLGGIHGVTTSIVLAYEIVTADDQTVIGSIYTGGKASAIGLVHIMRERLSRMQE